jgi:hypothetical protein
MKMKKNITIVFSLFTLVLCAQDKVNINADQYAVDETDPPLFKQFTKETTFRINFPERITYSSGLELQTIFNQQNYYGTSFPYYFLAAPKAVQYEAIIICPGMSNLVSRGDKRFNLDGRTGLIRYYSASYPCRIQIKRNDTLVKDIELYAANFKHAFILTKTGMMNGPFYERKDLLFDTPMEVEMTARASAKQMERFLATYVTQQVYETLMDLFGSRFKQAQTVSIGIVEKKKRNFDFNDLDSVNLKFKQGMEALSKGDVKTKDALLQQCLAFYENLLKSTEPRVEPDVKMIMHVNLAQTNYFLSRIGQAEQHLSELLKSPYQSIRSEIYKQIDYRIQRYRQRERFGK